MPGGRKRGTLVRCTCKVCKTVEINTGAGSHYRCTTCKAAGLRIPRQGRASWNGKEEAGVIVAQLIREGKLLHASNLACADCAGPATEYEHRDYNKPEVVEPICRGCNLRRGPGIPVEGSIERLVARGMSPYRLKRSALRLFATMGRSTHMLDGMPSKLKVEHWRVILADQTQPKVSPAFDYIVQSLTMDWRMSHTQALEASNV